MSTVGPKGPSDTSAMAKVLQFRRPEVNQTTAVTAPTETSTEQVPTTEPAARFDTTAGQSQQISAPVEGAALSQLVARLKARGTDGANTTGVVGPTVIDTAEGKVLSGSVQIESRAGLHKLDGIVRVGGSLAVEGILKSADLLALRDLKVVEGRLTFEGMRHKSTET